MEPGWFEGRLNLLLCPAGAEYETARKERTHVIVLSFQRSGLESSDPKVRKERPDLVHHQLRGHL